MNIEANDPRLTQYALGEMDPKDAAAFERELDGRARAEVEAIRAMAGAVEAELAGEAGPELTEAQRGAVVKAAAASRGIPYWVVPLAACAVLAVGAWMFANEQTRYTAERASVEAEEQAARQRIPHAVVGETPTPEGVRPMVLHDDNGRQADGHDVKFTQPDMPVAEEEIAIDALENRVAPAQVRVPVADPNVRALHRLRLVEEVVEAPRNTEAYDHVPENGFVAVEKRDVSTFSIDVDTASYANVRRFLMQHRRLPPADAVRVEELINYFNYDYAPPAADSPHPFAAHVEVTGCPWNSAHRLARIGIKGRVLEQGKRPRANLVFLLDVSGSMDQPNKLPLLKQSMKLLVGNLTENDRVAIVVYAGASGVVLPSTAAANSGEILAALSRLNAGGSTNGGAGIQLAYDIAQQNFAKEGVNRVVLCTDGDFNVGVTDRGALTRLIEEKAKSGVFLSVLGFGSGNYKDATMEQLSNKGNGNYAYIDSLREARKALVEEMGGTLVTIAKDVKIQVYFNPAEVAGWRLIGYENRLLAAQDFNDDKKDAGEIGAGHTVTALYEIIPAGTALPGKVDPNPFKEAPKELDVGKEPRKGLLQLRLRYKQPAGDTSTLMESIVEDGGGSFDQSSKDLQFAAAVAGFAQILRGSSHVEGMGLEAVAEIASSALGEDRGGYRAEFVDLCRMAGQLEADAPRRRR